MKTFRFFAFLSLSALAFGGYKVESAGAPPQELAPAVVAQLQAEGQKVTDDAGKVICEVWMRKSLPAGASNGEESATFTDVAHGTFMGAIRYPARGSDRRGQPIKAGVYLLRISFFPVNGAHQGVAPQRDFFILTPAAADQDPAAAVAYEPLMDMGRKAAGSPHPPVLSIWKVESDFAPGVSQMGDHDWILQTKVGEVPIAIIVVGVAEA